MSAIGVAVLFVGAALPGFLESKFLEKRSNFRQIQLGDIRFDILNVFHSKSGTV